MNKIDKWLSEHFNEDLPKAMREGSVEAITMIVTWKLLENVIWNEYILAGICISVVMIVWEIYRYVKRNRKGKEGVARK